MRTIALPLAVILVNLMIAVSSANAGQFSFFCSVDNAYSLDDQAAIKSDPANRFRGERFSLDRRTGQITGERIPAFRADKFVVLFPGKDGNSFKSYFQGQNFVSYFEVYEYREGKKKPFVLHDGIFILSGLCD